jgi:hypothetical protein
MDYLSGLSGVFIEYFPLCQKELLAPLKTAKFQTAKILVADLHNLKIYGISLRF